MEEEYSPAELIEERQRRVDEMNGMCVLPEGTTARQFLQMVMRGEIDPAPKQLFSKHGQLKIAEVVFNSPTKSVPALSSSDALTGLQGSLR